jgi:hypothetical protein
MAIGKHEVTCARGAQRVSRVVQIDIDAVVDARCDGIAPPSISATKAAGWGGVAVGAGIFGYAAYGLGSYFLVDKQDPRFGDPRYEVTTNKTWGGPLYLIGGAAVSVASYMFLVRDPAASQTGTATLPAPIATDAAQTADTPPTWTATARATDPEVQDLSVQSGTR